MIYTCKEPIKLSRSEFERYRKLFKVDLNQIDDNGDLLPEMEQLADEADYREDTEVCEFWWFFEDGSAISWKIICGDCNAYDDAIWWNRAELITNNGEEIVKIGDEAADYEMEPGFSIDETMEFCVNGNSYICQIEIKEGT